MSASESTATRGVRKGVDKVPHIVPAAEATRAAMLTIGKVAKRSKVSADTIRFYERDGLIRPAGKSAAGYRLYTEEAIRRIEFICAAMRFLARRRSRAARVAKHE